MEVWSVPLSGRFTCTYVFCTHTTITRPSATHGRSGAVVDRQMPTFAGNQIVTIVSPRVFS
jgi:hypothetical protein